MKMLIFIPLFLSLISPANAEYLHGEYDVNDCVITKTTLECSSGDAAVKRDFFILNRSEIRFIKSETKFKVKTTAVIMGQPFQELHFKGSAKEVDAFMRKLF